MAKSNDNVAINLPIMRDIYREILAKSHPHMSLQNVCPLAFSGNNSFTAFWQVIADVPEATLVRDNPSRIELTLYKKGAISIAHTQGSFGRRILDCTTPNIKKLTLESAPIWTRNWIKEFVNHNNLEELIIECKVEVGAFEILAKIAESVKRLVDKTGQVVSKLKKGNFDYLSIRMRNFSWPENLLSNINFTTKHFQCVVNEVSVQHTLIKIQREFAKVSSDKLSAVKTFHIKFWVSCPQKSFQPFIDTIVEIMPYVENIIITISTDNPGLDRAYMFLPNAIGRTYEAVQQIVPPLGVNVKIRVVANTKTYVYSNTFELPSRILNVLRTMTKVPFNKNVSVSTSTRSLTNEKNRYQQWEFKAGNELGNQKEFCCDLTVYVEKF